MIVKLNMYRVNIPAIETFLKSKKDRKLGSLISELGTMTNCPLIVICFFIGEIRAGFEPELIETIQRLKEFYGYTDVLEVKGEKPCFP